MMIVTENPVPDAHSALKATAAGKAKLIVTHAMRATSTQPVFRAVEMAWPAITDVVSRLAYYLSDQVSIPGEAPLLHVSLSRFQEQMGNWQNDGLSTQTIRHSLAAMLCTVRELAGIQVWRGEYRWDPTLGVSFIDFAQGQPVRIESGAGNPPLHPDDILRVIGNYALMPAALRSLSRDLRKLIREYEASCRP